MSARPRAGSKYRKGGCLDENCLRFLSVYGVLFAPYLSLPLSDEISMPWASMGCNGFFWENAEYLVYSKGLAQDLASLKSTYRPFLAYYGHFTAISSKSPLTRIFFTFWGIWPISLENPCPAPPSAADKAPIQTKNRAQGPIFHLNPMKSQNDPLGHPAANQPLGKAGIGLRRSAIAQCNRRACIPRKAHINRQGQFPKKGQVLPLRFCRHAAMAK